MAFPFISVFSVFLLLLLLFRRKSKGHWNLNSPYSSESIEIDLTEISSSEIPSDLSIDEEDFWSNWSEDEKENFENSGNFNDAMVNGFVKKFASL